VSPALVLIVVVLVIVASAGRVWSDARRRLDRGRPIVFSLGTFEISTPAAWLFGNLVLWIFIVPLYLTSRD
jgi:hypothetical protein